MAERTGGGRDSEPSAAAVSRPPERSESGVAIRPARVEDAEAIAELGAQLGYPPGAAAMRRRLERLAASEQHGLFVAEQGQAVVGWMHACRHESLVADDVALLAGLVVDGRRRGRGIGRRLVEAAEGWARARGFVEMRVRSRTERADAHAFYRRVGFEARKTQLLLGKRLDG